VPASEAVFIGWGKKKKKKNKGVPLQRAKRFQALSSLAHSAASSAVKISAASDLIGSN
jgi:hypothetical protein